MNKFLRILSVVCLCVFLLTTVASANSITAEYFNSANLVIIKGTTDKADLRKPIAIDIVDSDGELLYTNQKRADSSEFEFKFPLTLLGSLDEYIAKVRINGKYSRVDLKNGINFTANKTWNSSSKTLTLYGNFVYEGYATTNDVNIVVTSSDGDDVLYEGSCGVEDDYVYSFDVNFSGKAYDNYQITITTEKDNTNLVFAYKDTDDIIENLTTLSADELEEELTDIENMELMSLINWTSINNKKITELDSSVFEILANGMDNVDNIDSLLLELDRAVFTYMVNQASDESDAYDIATSNTGDHFRMSMLQAYEHYKLLDKDENEHIAVFSAVAGKGIKSFDRLLEALSDEIIFTHLNKCEEWSQIKAITEPYITYLGIKGTVTKSMYEKAEKQFPFDTLEDYVNKINSYINSNKDDDDEPDSTTSAKRYPSVSATGTTAPVVTPATQPVIFNDIAHVSWASEAITELYKKGIVNGVSEGIFSPDAYVTREQFVKLLVLAFNITTNGETQIDFADVDATQWYAQYVSLAASNGITTGKGDGSFGIGDTLTRQDAATLIYRLVKPTEEIQIPEMTFSDSAFVAEYAKEAVSFLSDKGIISGVGNGNFEPMALCTRAQAAKIIYSVLGL